MSYAELLKNKIHHTGRMYFVISRGTIKRMILKGISNKLVHEINRIVKKKKIDEYQRSQERKNKETTQEENESNSKMMLKPIHIGNYVKFKWIKHFSGNTNIVRLYK